MRRLAITLSIKSLLTIYKCFVRPYLHYGDILYGKAKKKYFKNKIEKIYFKPWPIITGTIQGTS